jgi:uncharacterized membrane protein YccC
MSAAKRPTTALDVARGIVREATRLDPSGVAVRFGLRCAAGVAIVLVGSLATGHPMEGVSAAVGAFIVGFASRQGVYRTRAAAMLLTSAAMGLATFLAAVSGANLFATVAIALVLGFAAGMLASLGPVWTTIGLNSLVAFAIFGQFHETPLQALERAGWVISGGVLQTILLVAVWPLARFSAERKVLANAYRALADYARDFPRVKLRSPNSAAFSALSDTLADPQPFARRGEIAAFEALLVEAERIRASLGALTADLYKLEREGRRDAARAVISLGEGAASILERVAEALDAAEAPSDWDDFWESIEARGERVEHRAPPQTARDARALLGQLRSAWRIAETPAREEIVAPLPETPEHPAAAFHTSSRFAEALRTLRANASPNSAFAQHGVRLAVTLAVAECLAHFLPLQRGYWVPLTAVLVLRSDFATTFSRGVARLLGTLLGAVVASLVALTHPGAEAHLVLALVFATVAFVVFNVNYGAFTTAVTAYVVFLLAFGGLPEHAALLDRIEASLVGGSLALVAYAFWPTWERDIVPVRLAELLEAQNAYSSLVLDAYLGGTRASDETIHAAQLAAWRTRSNAEASVDRMLAEPVPPTAVTVRAALGILAASRRFGLAALTLQSRISEGQPAIAAAVPLVAAIRTTFRDIAAAVRARRDPESLPPLRDLQATLTHAVHNDPEAHTRAFLSETDLMVDSLNGIADVLHRLAASRASDAEGAAVRPESLPDART